MEIEQNIQLLTNNQRQITLPRRAAISVWIPTSLTYIDNTIQYDIPILGRVLDQIMELPIMPQPQVPTAPFGSLGTTITDLRDKSRYE